jgi:hypothetical protein
MVAQAFKRAWSEMIKENKLIHGICGMLIVLTFVRAQQTDFPSRELSGLTGPDHGRKPPGIPAMTEHSNSEALRCLTRYIEAMNSQQDRDLLSFFAAYYGNSDHTKRLELEASLKMIWRQLTAVKIAYDSEKETILLISSPKVPDSYLVFDLKLTGNGRIEFFTRTGVKKRPEGEPVSIQEIVAIADRAVPINDSVIEQSTMEIAEAYDAQYFIPETGRRISRMLIDNLGSGKYSRIRKAREFADSLKEDILKLHFDSHSWIEADRKLLPEYLASPSSHNFGFERVEILDGNIGYIKFNEFNPQREAQAAADQALGSVADCIGLILDLRDNVGGYPGMIKFIAGHFFSKPTKVNTLFDRNGRAVEEIWTMEDNSGRKFGDNFPLAILTSKRTASAAESFVNFFKKQRRATIIGETTAGARHPAKEIRIGTLFTVSIPILRGEEDAVEGQGIVPDIPVQDGKALDEAVKLIRKIKNDYSE